MGRTEAGGRCRTYHELICCVSMLSDPCLDTLLDLDGTTIVYEDLRYWVKFEVKRVEADVRRPHGLDYSLTLHGPNSGRPYDSRLVGFDNAHAVPSSSGPAGRRREAWDHEHRIRSIRPYDYTDAGRLLEDFWAQVDRVMAERKTT